MYSQYGLWCDIMTLGLCIYVSVHQGKRKFALRGNVGGYVNVTHFHSCRWPVYPEADVEVWSSVVCWVCATLFPVHHKSQLGTGIKAVSQKNTWAVPRENMPQVSQANWIFFNRGMPSVCYIFLRGMAFWFDESRGMPCSINQCMYWPDFYRGMPSFFQRYFYLGLIIFL